MGNITFKHLVAVSFAMSAAVVTIDRHFNSDQVDQIYKSPNVFHGTTKFRLPSCPDVRSNFFSVKEEVKIEDIEDGLFRVVGDNGTHVCFDSDYLGTAIVLVDRPYNDQGDRQIGNVEFYHVEDGYHYKTLNDIVLWSGDL